MKNINKSETLEFENLEIDLNDLFKTLYAKKLFIIIITFVAFIMAFVYSKSLPDIYESKVLLVPTESNSNFSNSLQRYSGLASMAGINLPSESSDTNAQQAIEKIASLSFFENNILPKIFLPNLMAISSWRPEKNLIEYHDAIYDSITNTWVRKFNYPQKLIPSAQESYSVFKKEHLRVIHNDKNNYLTIKVRHQSPYIAREWAELVINEINSYYRDKDRVEAEKAINYLNLQMTKTNFSEIKQVVAQLLQQETQKLTLIEANNFYVYEYIDPPVVMERNSEPNRVFIVILGALFGLMISVIIVLTKHYVFSRNQTTR